MLAFPYSRTLTGPQEIPAAEAVSDAERRRNLWPYKWVMPPLDSIRRDPMGFVASPAIGAANQVVILEFDVPSGYDFLMTDLLIGAFGLGQIPIGQPGDFTLSIDKNTPLGGGALQGSPIADWNNIPFNIGAIVGYGPWKLPRAEWFDAEDQIRAKAINNALGVAAPNMFCALFGGWLIPREK